MHVHACIDSTDSIDSIDSLLYYCMTIIWTLHYYYNEYMCSYFVYSQGNPGVVDKSG